MATVVAVDASNAPHTWVAPFSAASSDGTLFSLKRTVFSSTTIAPSSTIPIANASPASEIMFRERPASCNTRNAVNRQIGIATATIKVARNRRRNHQRMPVASVIPSNRFVRNMAMESVMYSDSS